VLARLDKTYQAFFRRVQRGEKAGFPRFKGRNRYHSFTFKEYGNGARLDNGYLVLAKIGRINAQWSRPVEGTPRTVTICKEADGWYVAIACADVPVRPLPATGQETGIDLGLGSFAALADGTRIQTPGHRRRAERSLAKCQRLVSRRKQDTHRRRTPVCALAKAHQTVRRQRLDFSHKTALHLVRQYDAISHEELRFANLVKNYRLAKSIADAGWGAFLTMLSFKAASAGRRVVAVDRSPKRTVVCRSTTRVWVLLHRGQLHLSLMTAASARRSTGVAPLRGTPGGLLGADRATNGAGRTRLGFRLASLLPRLPPTTVERSESSIQLSPPSLSSLQPSPSPEVLSASGRMCSSWAAVPPDAHGGGECTRDAGRRGEVRLGHWKR
jgi:IS605 OrfB family transposase